MSPIRTLSAALALACAAVTVAWSPSQDVRLPDRARHGDVLLAQNTQIQVVTLGTHNGTLAAGDSQLSTGEYYDAWEFDGTNGQVLRIRMDSSALDPYLTLRGPAGTSLDNDDRQPGDLNAEIVITLPMTARYQIMTTSYQPGETGAYTLQIEQTGGTGQAVAVAPGSSSGTTLEAGVPVSGSLAAGDTTLNSGEFSDTWFYTGHAGERLTVNLDSSQFDPYLMIRGATLSEDNDDRVDGNLNSTINVTLPTAGDYRIIATSYQPGESGAYTLDLQSSEQTVPAASSNALTPGSRRRGEFTTSDPMRAGRQYFDVYTLSGQATQRVLIEASGRRMTTSLRLIYPNGTEETANASAPGGTASLNAVLPMTGEYTLHVSTVEAATLGNYDVELTTASVAAAPLSNRPAATGTALQVGTTTQGELARGDAQLDTGEYFDSYTLAAQAGQAITLELRSTAMDPYIFVRGPSDFSRDNDDGPNMGLNSRLDIVFSQTGTYSVVATSYAAGEVGAYTLSLSEGTSPADSASGSIFAVSGGITAYQTASQLSGCADDARFLFETLQQSGLLAPQSSVLTDAGLTRASLRQAFTSVGNAMTADDVFIFFFSGHGSQIPGNEFDDTDETIVLFDGEMRDDELAELFDLIPGRVAIVALDSCFSGGFARDVISRENRMGIFSSEEDVTSNVAVRFEAGGFLSYFLREGLAGAADIEPMDRVITAGELTQYLRQQWAQHMLNERTETSDSESAWQNLVIDRGSVKVSDVILHQSSSAR